MAKAEKALTQETPFYVKHKHGGSFVDHESKLHVHGNNIAEVNSPVGTQTRQFLRQGGLVKVSDEDVAKAEAEGRIMDGKSFGTSTKIVMVPGIDDSGATVQHPKEVPLEDGDVEKNPEDTVDEEEDEDEDEDEESEDEDDEDDQPGLQSLLNAPDPEAIKAKKKAKADAKKAKPVVQKTNTVV